MPAILINLGDCEVSTIADECGEIADDIDRPDNRAGFLACRLFGAKPSGEREG
jgi:hypothetical protein